MRRIKLAIVATCTAVAAATTITPEVPTSSRWTMPLRSGGPGVEGIQLPWLVPGADETWGPGASPRPVLAALDASAGTGQGGLHQLPIHGAYDDVVNIHLGLSEVLMLEPSSVDASAVRGQADVVSGVATEALIELLPVR